MSRILMVEEERGMVQQVEERLSKAGFEVFSAFDGRQGFQMAKEKTPDLIITDALLPGISGYDLCKAIKLDEETKSIPIIVMTEKHRMEDSFMFLGVKDFLNKPFSMDELEAAVRKELDLYQTLHLQKSKILVNGRPQVLECCQQLIKNAPHWIGYYSSDSHSLLQEAVKYAPDVVMVDLLLPGTVPEDIIKKLAAAMELKHSVILTYYTTASVSQDSFANQAQAIEVQYLKTLTLEAGAKEYLGPFNPVTFLNLIDIYRRDYKPAV